MLGVGWWRTSVFAVLIVRVNFWHASANKSMLAYMSSLHDSLRAQNSAYRKSLAWFTWTFVGALSLVGFKIHHHQIDIWSRYQLNPLWRLPWALLRTSCWRVLEQEPTLVLLHLRQGKALKKSHYLVPAFHHGIGEWWHWKYLDSQILPLSFTSPLWTQFQMPCQIYKCSKDLNILFNSFFL